MSKIIRLDGTWVSTAQAAEILGVSVQYMYRLRELDKLVPTKVGSANMYRRVEIERYALAHPMLGVRRAAR